MRARAEIGWDQGFPDGGGYLGNLVLHALEVADGLAKLVALVEIRHGRLETAFRQTQHLSADPDPALVQDLNRILVPI